MKAFEEFHQYVNYTQYQKPFQQICVNTKIGPLLWIQVHSTLLTFRDEFICLFTSVEAITSVNKSALQCNNTGGEQGLQRKTDAHRSAERGDRSLSPNGN